MVRNYFKTAWRTLVRGGIYSILNIGGLGVGLMMVILIFLWIREEITYNHYHSNYKDIAMVISVETINGETTAEKTSSVALASALRNSYSRNFKGLSLLAGNPQALEANDKKLNHTGYWVEKDFLPMFGFKMLKGKTTALNDPSSIVLSEATALALFGTTDVIGRPIKLNDSTILQVTGIYEDIPDNSRFSGTAYLTAWENPSNPGNKHTGDWIDHHYQLFVWLAPGTSAASLTIQIRNITKPYIKGSWEEILLQPMDKWLLFDKYENGQMVAGQMRTVRMVGIIGLFILLLACINYMNLSTARSMGRAREVGVRKVMGSNKTQLQAQFFIESFCITLAAMIIALVLAQLFLNRFNDISGKQLHIPYNEPFFVISIFLFIVFTAIVAGTYPAAYLSQFRASEVLKAGIKQKGGARTARRLLVVLQFSVAVSLIIGTIAVFRQIQYVKSRPVGYSRERLLTVTMNTPELKKHFESISHALLKTGMVSTIAAASSATTNIENAMMGYDWEGRDANSVPIINTVFHTVDFGKTIGWKIIQGRDFSAAFPADSGAFIINEAAVKFMGLQAPVVGKMIRWHGKENPIVGVVQDMIMGSPYSSNDPVFFTLQPNPRIHLFLIRVNPAVSIHEAVSSMAIVFKQFNPGAAFEYRFTEDVYMAKFAREEQLGRLAYIAAIFAIFISCIGLFGLSSFIAEQRTREIGIRKVLGATVLNIWKLLTQEFAMLVLVSISLAIPVSYFTLYNWLQDYSYRVSLDWWIFASAAISVTMIAIATVSFHAVRAALTNPVKSLRSL
jgi:putative ABC transport system permease protein